MSRPQSPAASGRVIDVQTLMPIAQAHVFFIGYPRSQTMTGTNGCFQIYSTFKTCWASPLPFDSFVPLGVMVVEAPGYQVFVFDQTAQPPGTIVSGMDFEIRKQ